MGDHMSKDARTTVELDEARRCYTSSPACFSIDSLVFSATDVLSGCAFSACMAFFWLLFGFGICDPLISDGYMGYLLYGVPLAIGIVGIILICAVRFSPCTDALASSQAFALIAGTVCCAASIPLTTELQGGIHLWAQYTMLILQTAGITWCTFLAIRELAQCRDELKVIIIVHADLVLSFVFYSMVLALDGVARAAAFAMLPLLASLLLVISKRLCYTRPRISRNTFWIVSPAIACALIDDRLKDARAAKPSDDGRPSLRRIFIGLGIFCFYISFVRSLCLTAQDTAEQHSVGASISIAIVAALAIVMLAIMFIVKNRRGHLREYYIASGCGLCFAALILVLTGQNNLFVRIIEDISYILYFFTTLYSIVIHIKRYQLPVSKTLATAFVIIAFSNALGWSAQMLSAAFITDDDAMLILILALTFVVLAYLIFSFSPQIAQSLVAVDAPVSSPAPTGTNHNGESAVQDVDHDAVGAVRDVDHDTVGAMQNVDHDAVGTVQDVDATRSATNGPSAASCENPPATPSSEPPAASRTSSPISKSEQGHHTTFKDAAAAFATEAGLSKRETEILFSIIKGWSDQRIADELTVSYHTVRAHVRHIYEKTYMHSRDELLDAINDHQQRLNNSEK